MGCCMSSTSHRHQQLQTPTQKPPPQEAKITTPSTWNSLQRQQEAAAPVVEEETVKEVTHFTNPTSTIPEPKAQFIKTEKNLKEEDIRTPEISQSQASEICSVNDTVSAGTSVSVGIGREDEATSKKKRVEMRSSPGKVAIKKKPNSVGRTERRGGVVRKNGVGERSERRSRSPVTGAGGVGRGRVGGSTGKVTGKAGGRLVGVGEGGGSGVKEEGPNDDVLMADAGRHEEKGSDDGLVALGDNPLVSLECFIFL